MFPYWSGSDFMPDPNAAWAFQFNGGTQGIGSKPLIGNNFDGLRSATKAINATG